MKTVLLNLYFCKVEKEVLEVKLQVAKGIYISTAESSVIKRGDFNLLKLV